MRMLLVSLYIRGVVKDNAARQGRSLYSYAQFKSLHFADVEIRLAAIAKHVYTACSVA